MLTDRIHAWYVSLRLAKYTIHGSYWLWHRKFRRSSDFPHHLLRGMWKKTERRVFERPLETDSCDSGPKPTVYHWQCVNPTTKVAKGGMKAINQRNEMFLVWPAWKNIT